MQKHLLPLILLVELALIGPAAADDEPLIIFSMKNFTDTGDMVHVEGTLTGDGIGYKNNRSALTCYHDTGECIATHVDAEGRQLFLIGPPVIFTIRLWAADRIVADFAVPCGKKPKSDFPDSPLSKEEWQSNASDTWIIDRSANGGIDRSPMFRSENLPLDNRGPAVLEESQEPVMFRWPRSTPNNWFR
jgi:hypothetical protein